HKRRFVFIACADGDRFPEAFDFHRTCCGEESCIHSQLRHGGALVLAPASPLGRRGGLDHRGCYLHELKESVDIKQTKEFVLYAHFPCGAASAAHISAKDALDLLVSAKDYLRHEIEGAQVSLFIHVDYEGHRQEQRFKTYFFNRD